MGLPDPDASATASLPVRNRNLTTTMLWTDDILDRLSAQLPCGYHATGPVSTEPTALAALALLAANREASARTLLAWLAGLQATDGSIGPTATQSTPGWPTSLAVLATLFAQRNGLAARTFDANRGVAWILQTRGEALPRTPEMGHDTTLVGWPWIEETHSWIEPTAMHVLALKAAGHSDHPRTREAVRLLIDRLLPDGGCNYGNTVVMGQTLRPHLQPTGLTMLALAGEADRDGRIKKSLEYLAAELPSIAAAASLSDGLLGLAACTIVCRARAHAWLERAYRRTIARDGQAVSTRSDSRLLAAMGRPNVLLVALPRRTA